MNARELVEYLSRGIVLRRRLPREFGRIPIYVSPEAALRYWLRMSDVDPMLYHMARELVQPNCVVWDVGANVGLFSFCAAHRAGSSGFVLALEPDLWLAQLIARSARLADRNGIAPVRILPAAASDSNRVSHLQIARRSRAANYIAESQGTSQADGTRYTQETMTVTLDFLMDYFPMPAVLKIDVELHEARVLAGARKLLRAARPIIWCEVSPENSQAVTDLLHSENYNLYSAAEPPSERSVITKAHWHTLALPK